LRPGGGRLLGRWLLDGWLLSRILDLVEEDDLCPLCFLDLERRLQPCPHLDDAALPNCKIGQDHVVHVN
jgi:hypothetical protein